MQYRPKFLYKKQFETTNNMIKIDKNFNRKWTLQMQLNFFHNYISHVKNYSDSSVGDIGRNLYLENNKRSWSQD